MENPETMYKKPSVYRPFPWVSNRGGGRLTPMLINACSRPRRKAGAGIALALTAVVFAAPAAFFASPAAAQVAPAVSAASTPVPAEVSPAPAAPQPVASTVSPGSTPMQGAVAAQAAYRLGRQAQASGRSDEARRHFQDAIQLDGAFPEPHYALAVSFLPFKPGAAGTAFLDGLRAQWSTFRGQHRLVLNICFFLLLTV